MGGNAREWCWNESDGRRFILGGSYADPNYMLTRGETAPPLDRSRTNGFRCMKYKANDGAAGKLTAPLAPYAPPKYLTAPPAGDEEFQRYRRLYQYEKTPLAAEVKARDGNSDSWQRREKIEFRAAYGSEKGGRPALPAQTGEKLLLINALCSFPARPQTGAAGQTIFGRRLTSYAVEGRCCIPFTKARWNDSCRV